MVKGACKGYDQKSDRHVDGVDDHSGEVLYFYKVLCIDEPCETAEDDQRTIISIIYQYICLTAKTKASCFPF